MYNEYYKLPEITFVEDSSCFVGLYIQNGELKISAPKMLRFSDDENIKKQEIILFLNSINLAKSIDRNSLNNTNGISDIAWPFDSYLWIIEDFLSNGFYYSREKTFINENKGKIEWKKTLKNSPLISNGNLVYTKFVTSIINPTNDDIAIIYSYCLKLSSERIGWLFNFDIPVKYNKSKSLSEMIHILKKNLSSTFDDIKSIRFKHMLKILENSTEDRHTSNNFLFGINNYYYVFEKMIDIYFDGINEKEKKTFNPKGNWNLNSSKNIHPSSNLRPDTILEYNNVLYILDSKMYQFGYTGNPKHLPETTSMQKQITYGDYIATKYQQDKIRNVFIIPFNKDLDIFYNKEFGYTLVSLDNNNNLQYLGYAFTEWRENSEKKPYDYIYTFLIDMNFLLCHFNKTNAHNTELMISKIEELVAKVA